jgi:ABC-type transport system involved in multi-copper enzyme maturation permease subunit
VSAYLSGIGVVVGLELKQRVRSVAWYVLLGVSGFLVLVVTAVLGLSLGAFGDDDVGGTVFSALIFFVLLLGTLVSPAVSGNAVNGDRDAGTLATTQVTQTTAGQLVLGKFLAAWLTALAFLAVSVPFLIVAVVIGGVPLATVLISLPVVAVELGVVAAVGVGLSGVIQRPLFSVVVTYLVVAALSLGTLIAFGLATLAVRTEVTQISVDVDYEASEYDEQTGEITGEIVCAEPYEYTYEQPRTDLVWWLLAANPYVVVADAVPPVFNAEGYGNDLFTGIAGGVRQAQIAPEAEQFVDYCSTYDNLYGGGVVDTPEDIYARTVPSWFVGLIIHVALAAVALWGATRSLRTPSTRLAKGSRIA